MATRAARRGLHLETLLLLLALSHSTRQQDPLLAHARHHLPRSYVPPGRVRVDPAHDRGAQRVRGHFRLPRHVATAAPQAVRVRAGTWARNTSHERKTGVSIFPSSDETKPGTQKTPVYVFWSSKFSFTKGLLRTTHSARYWESLGRESVPECIFSILR